MLAGPRLSHINFFYFYIQMKKITLTLMALAMTIGAMAQHVHNDSPMMKEWRQLKQQRDYSKQATQTGFPLGEALETKSADVKALPDDRVWFPGEWEEVQAILVTPSYNYYPDSNLGSGYYIADPVVTGVGEYFKYNSTRGWVTTNIYGPYHSVMDTSSAFGRVFFYLMDGIQQGHAQAWVRVEQPQDSLQVLRTLARLGLRSNNVRFIVGPGNSFWYRDCGPICFYHGDQDSLAMMDFEYYPGRALDDSLPSLVYRQMGLPNYINTIEWEGGNCLVDGAGFLLSSDAVYGNNSDSYGQFTWDGRNISSIHHINKTRLTNSQTRHALSSLLGQRETHILPAYQYDGGTGHIDLYADMVEENGFVFSVMPQAYSTWTDYRTGARNMDSLCSYTSIFDRPYYRTDIPFPSTDNGNNFSSQSEYNLYYTRTYSNHTFVNDLILQPCFSTVVNGRPSAAWDQQNIEKLKAAYPGYTIYPVDVREFDGSGGAIHCVTKQIPADNPVRILHKSIVGSANAMRGHDVPVSAIITNRSGIASAQAIYRIDGGQWSTVELTANGNKFSGLLPTASINERIIDTAHVPRTTIDSTLISIDTAILSIDSIVVDADLIIDTTYSYTYHYSYDTTHYTDTVASLRDTLVTIEYYIRATSNNGKTITKPMTAHQGGYYSFYYNGQEELLDSINYDFDTLPRPASDITFVFDANRTTLDTSTTPVVGIEQVSPLQNFGQFYPNPSSEQAHININLGDGGRYQVAIYDNMGRLVHTAHLNTAGSIVFTVNTGKLASGLYNVVFSSGSTQVLRRLVVK